MPPRRDPITGTTVTVEIRGGDLRWDPPGAVVNDQLGTEKSSKQELDDHRRAELENPSNVGRFFDHVANNIREDEIS